MENRTPIYPIDWFARNANGRSAYSASLYDIEQVHFEIEATAYVHGYGAARSCLAVSVTPKNSTPTRTKRSTNMCECVQKSSAGYRRCGWIVCAICDGMID